MYVLLCADNSLYTGITIDIKKRLATHRSGEGSKYVRSRLPVKLIHTEKFVNKSLAAKREALIKGWDRKKKIRALGLTMQ